MVDVFKICDLLTMSYIYKVFIELYEMSFSKGKNKNMYNLVIFKDHLQKTMCFSKPSMLGNLTTSLTNILKQKSTSSLV